MMISAVPLPVPGCFLCEVLSSVEWKSSTGLRPWGLLFLQVPTSAPNMAHWGLRGSAQGLPAPRLPPFQAPSNKTVFAQRSCFPLAWWFLSLGLEKVRYCSDEMCCFLLTSASPSPPGWDRNKAESTLGRTANISSTPIWQRKRQDVTCPRSHSSSAAKLELKFRMSNSFNHSIHGFLVNT